MKIIQSKIDLRKAIQNARRKDKLIGFVPTMGFLHEGHLSLIERARSENDVVVVSIFVNPTQFGPNEDLDAYPRNEQRDINLMLSAGVDIAFFPTVEAMYPENHATCVEVEGTMAQVLCGCSRPTHFKGVTTIVAKLFNLVSPNRAYFGQKDAQQAIIIQQMVQDLDFDLQIVVCPIIREKDGLAMSSRNVYLTEDQRSRATILYRSLSNAEKMINNGERNAAIIKNQIEAEINAIKEVTIDYVSIVDASSLEEVEAFSGEIVIALAVKFDATRLIDNIQIKV